MSFEKALECFDDNKKQLRVPTRDPVLWNLSVGLANLTLALQDLSSRLSGIEQALQRLK